MGYHARRLEGLSVLPFLCLAGVVAGGCADGSAHSDPLAQTTPSRSESGDPVREDALRRARVWRPPAVAIERANLRENPVGPTTFRTTDTVTCRFEPRQSSGVTPKFQCTLPGGESVKVKYGRQNAEVQTEVASTRLLAALGFGADRMSVVARVRCLGCPPYPMQRRWYDGFFSLFGRRVVEFDWVAIERRHPGVPVGLEDEEGWGWYELSKVDAAAGGSPAAEVDALRLMAVFLANWDNKADNQRLVCLDPAASQTPASSSYRRPCATPFAYMHDVGGTWGPMKINLETWSATPVFADARSCRLSMKALPFGGATFTDVEVSEEGRQFLADKIGRLSDAQLVDLFTAARFTEWEGNTAAARDVNRWVAAFRDKVRQITEHAPCGRRQAARPGD